MNVKINSESNETQQQTVSFSDQNQQWTYSVNNPLDGAHKALDSDDSDLNNFFSRPIKIASINWGVGSTVQQTINPWQLYFENLRVINRITNYNVLRSKLCVRIMINGNGFHYGRALASYRPLHNEDSMVTWRFGLVPQDIIGASQRMHVWIDPTKSQGGTICLPFVYYKNALNIPEQDWRNMGELDIASVTTLEHANGGTDSVTISVFAWAEDVSLAMPTVAEPGSLAPQSNEYNEAASGIISGPASVVQRAAAALTAVPQIAPFARATEMAASAVGNVAKLFGMSRPVDAGPISSYKPTYFGNIANSNVMDTSQKLTYDVKQELTIDPIAVGLGPDDEMAIASIASRESYLTQFQWSTTDTPESLIWNCHVTPSLFDTATPGVGTEQHLTPVAFVSRPFENWRGTLKYRFQIVASAFHKGRLKIVYDPYFNSTSEYNTQYTHVIDLAKERDFTVDINWGQEFSYLDHDDNYTSVPFSTTALTGPFHNDSNGVIAVYVVNDLTTPSATLSDVSVLVSVSAGDDFEVVNPNTANTQYLTYWQPQSSQAEPAYFRPRKFVQQSNDLKSADEDLTTQETKPIETTTEASMGVETQLSDPAQMLYFSDPVYSIRQILKRYENARMSSTLETTANTVYYAEKFPNFPSYRGYDPNGYYDAAVPVDPTPYTYANTTLMNYFTPAFLARRGGIRHKFLYSGPKNGRIMTVTRSSENGATGMFRFARGLIGTASESELIVSATSRAGTGDAGNGGAVTPVDYNPALEVEVPFMSNYRFAPARSKDCIGAGLWWSQAHWLTYPVGDNPGDVLVHDFVAAAEDFSLSFFQSVPVVWRLVPPNPSLL